MTAETVETQHVTHDDCEHDPVCAMLKQVENYLLRRESRLFTGTAERLWQQVCEYEGRQPTRKELRRVRALSWQLKQYADDFPHLSVQSGSHALGPMIVRAEVKALVLQA